MFWSVYPQEVWREGGRRGEARGGEARGELRHERLHLEVLLTGQRSMLLNLYDNTHT